MPLTAGKAWGSARWATGRRSIWVSTCAPLRFRPRWAASSRSCPPSPPRRLRVSWAGPSCGWWPRWPNPKATRSGWSWPGRCRWVNSLGWWARIGGRPRPTTPTALRTTASVAASGCSTNLTAWCASPACSNPTTPPCCAPPSLPKASASGATTATTTPATIPPRRVPTTRRHRPAATYRQTTRRPVPPTTPPPAHPRPVIPTTPPPAAQPATRRPPPQAPASAPGRHRHRLWMLVPESRRGPARWTRPWRPVIRWRRGGSTPSSRWPAPPWPPATGPTTPTTSPKSSWWSIMTSCRSTPRWAAANSTTAPPSPATPPGGCAATPASAPWSTATANPSTWAAPTAWSTAPNAAPCAFATDPAAPSLAAPPATSTPTTWSFGTTAAPPILRTCACCVGITTGSCTKAATRPRSSTATPASTDPTAPPSDHPTHHHPTPAAAPPTSAAGTATPATPSHPTPPRPAAAALPGGHPNPPSTPSSPDERRQPSRRRHRSVTGRRAIIGLPMTPLRPTVGAVFRRERLPDVASLAAGAVTALALPPWGWWPLALVGLVGLDRLIADQARRTRFRRGLLVGLGLYVPSLAWMLDMTAPGYAVAAVFYAALLGVAAAVVPAAAPGRWLALPGAIALVELLRWSWPFGGVPLSSLAVGQVAGPLAPVLRIGGALLLVEATVIVGVTLAAALNRRC